MRSGSLLKIKCGKRIYEMFVEGFFLDRKDYSKIAPLTWILERDVNDIFYLVYDVSVHGRGRERLRKGYVHIHFTLDPVKGLTVIAENHYYGNTVKQLNLKYLKFYNIFYRVHRKLYLNKEVSCERFNKKGNSS
jgi:hypothetical protein